MSSPVAIKVSAEFADSIRESAAASDRSLTGQIEHWAKLGRGAEEILPAPVAMAIKRCEGKLDAIEDAALKQRVLDALAGLRDGSHFQDTRRHLFDLGQPLFEQDAASPDSVVQVHPDGRRVTGKMVGRKFVPST